MANELKKVGLIFTQEGAVDFKKTLQDISLEMNKNYNQFKLTQSQWDSSTKSTEKLRAQQEYLTNAYAIQEDKVKVLKMQLEELENSENKNTTAIKKKRNELTNAEIKLKDYENKIKDVNSALNDTGKKIQDYGKKISDVSEKINDVGNKASVVSAGVAAGGVALANSAMSLEDAVAKYVSTTNVAEDETEKYKQVLESINKNNYGEGYDDIADSMAQVTAQLKDLNAQDLQNITEKAIALRDLFGYDVSESIRAVKAMMDNLNVSADEAFNLIAEGKKQGLDFSNELLDNINEYSVQFGKLGLSAEDMFNIFKVGADNGAFNLDKIGDAVKEFSIRVIDGSNTTVDGFKRIGLNADTMAKKFANGGEEAKQAFIEVVNRLGSMDDKVSQSIAGVDLFGTMWEDLGPTVITSFSKMDSGISKSSDSMQKSIDQLYNTTKKKAETQLKRLQSLGADFGEEMLPVLEDLIDMAEGFIEKLEGMSDAEKQNVMNIALFVAGLGPLTKAVGTVGQGIGAVTKGVGTLRTAIEVYRTGTESANESSNKLANGMKWLSSSAGIATTAFTAVTVGLGILKSQIDEEMSSIVEARTEIENNTQARQNSLDVINKELSANMAQMENTKLLREELSNLVDENGKVKEGYESRVQFILNQLNNALGTEYTMNDNIIKQYGDMQDNIDELILKKQAQLILEAQEKEAQEAINNKQQAYEDYLATQDKIAEVQQKINDLQDDWTWRGSADMIMRVNEYQGELEELQTTLGEQDAQLQKYNDKLTSYQTNSQLMLEGGVENYKKIEASVAQTQTNITNTANASLTERINNQIAANAKVKELYDLEAQYNQNAKDSIYAKNVEAGQKNLQLLADELVSKTSTIGTLGQQEIEAWRTLGSNSFDVYKEKLDNMDPTLAAKIQNLTGIITTDTSLETATGNQAGKMTDMFDQKLALSGKTADEIEAINSNLENDRSVKEGAEEIAGDANEGFNNNVDGTKWGQDLSDNISDGMTSKKSKIGITGAASAVAGWIKSILGHSVPEEGPLKDELTYMPDMIDNLVEGINKSRSKVKKATSEVAQDIKDELNLEESTSGIKKRQTATGITNIDDKKEELIDYDKMANAITKALTNCKFTLDEDGFARIVKDELYKVI